MPKNNVSLDRNRFQGQAGGAVVVNATEPSVSPGMTVAQHDAIGDTSPHHPKVTLDAASNAALVLAESTQVLKLVKNWLTLSEHAAIGNNSPHHIPANAGAGIATITSAQKIALNYDANAVWGGTHQFNDDVTFNDPVEFTDNVTARNIYPHAPDSDDLGSFLKPWRTIHASELDTVLFAQATATLFGGYSIVGHDTGTLGADLASTDTTCNFGKTMTVGDWVVMRSGDPVQVEYFLVGANVSENVYEVGGSDPYYPGARNLDGSGANNWPSGTAFLVLGQEGAGRIELNSYDTPRMSLLVQGDDWDHQDELVRIGDLKDLAGYPSTKYGAFFGQYGVGKAGIAIDADNGIRMLANGQKMGQWTPAGALLLGQTGSGKANVYWNPTNSRFEFRGNTTVQSYIDTDGAFVAGDGDITVNQAGLTIATEDTATPTLVKFVNGSATKRASLSAGTFGGANTLLLSSLGDGDSSDIDCSILLDAVSFDGDLEIRLLADTGTYNTTNLWVRTGPSYPTGQIELSANTIVFGPASGTGEVAVEDASLSVVHDSIIVYHDVASEYISGTSTGTLKITLPVSWSNTQLRIRIIGYDYYWQDGQPFEVIASGEPYSGEYWIGTAATITGDAPFADVRFGHDGTKACILLGTTSTSWNAISVAVVEVMAGASNRDDFGTGWDIKIITSESGITIGTYTYRGIPRPTFSTRRIAVGDPATGLPSNDGDIVCKKYMRAEGSRYYVGTGGAYIGLNGGKASYYDGSSWHDFY